MEKRTAVRILALVTLALLGTGVAHMTVNYTDPHTGVMLTLAGLLMGFLAFLLAAPDELSNGYIREFRAVSGRRRWVAAVGLVVSVLLGFAVTGDRLLGWLPLPVLDAVRPLLQLPPAPVQLIAWLSGMMLLWWGLTPAGEWRVLGDDLHELWQRSPGLIVGVLLIVLLALLVRVVNLEGATPILVGDEGPFGVHARAIADGRAPGIVIFGPSYFSHPWLFAYFLSPFVAVLGPTLTAIRLLPALFGVLTVLAVIWLGRELFDWRIGMTGGLFLATYPVHVHFSRLALNNVVDPCFVVLAFAALLYGLRKGRRWALILAGLSLGWSQYFYAGARLAPPLMAGFVLFLVIRYLRVGRQWWKPLLAVVVAFLAVTWPANAVLLGYRLPLTTRLEQTYALTAYTDWSSFLRAQVIPALMGFIHTYDAYFFYAGYTPMLLPPSAVAFLIGVAYLVRRVLAAPAILLLTWLISTAVFGGMILLWTPGYARYVIATPAIALTVAVGVVRLVDAALRRLSLNGAMVIVAVLALVNFLYYFGVHLSTHLDHVPPHGWQQDDLARRVAALDKDADIHLIVSNEQFPQHPLWMVEYFCGPRQIVWHQGSAGSLPTDLPAPDGPTAQAFFITPDRLNTLDMLRRQFPRGNMVMTGTAGHPGIPMLFLFYVPGPT